MYDSDEVRDAVKREMLTKFGPLPGITLTPLSVEMQAALDEARAWYAAGLQKALQVYLAEQEARRQATEAALEQWAAVVRARIEESLAGFVEELAKIGELAFEELRRALEPAAEAFRNLGLELDAQQEKQGEPSWKRRRREPDIRPVQHVDAVAAGRHPAMIDRTRIRGGRR